MSQDSTPSLPVHGSACLIVARNLGDAVIQSLFLRDLVGLGFARRYVVWARPQVAFLFEGLANCDIVTSQFPVGTNKQFDRQGAMGFLRAVRALRRMHLDVTIDLIGDFRERLFGRLTGSRRHLHIGWAPGHPFAKIIRNPFGRGRPAYEVPADQANVYQAHAAFLDALMTPRAAVGKTAEWPAARPQPRRIGLHPFASQECKLWPEQQWRQLAVRLQNEGAHLTAYGAPSERAALESMFGDLAVPVSIFTESIKSFAADVAGLDLMIGLDSFSVHMAERQGVRSIMLNACNHPTLWQPPHGESISKSGGCAAYPCMNVPVCESGAHPHVCIRSIDVDDVQRVIGLQSALEGSASR